MVDEWRACGLPPLTNDRTQDGGATEYLTAGPAIGKTIHVTGVDPEPGGDGSCGPAGRRAGFQGTRWCSDLGSSAPLGNNRLANSVLPGCARRKRRGEPSTSTMGRRHGVGRRSEHRPDGQPYFPTRRAAPDSMGPGYALPFNHSGPQRRLHGAERWKRIVGTPTSSAWARARMAPRSSFG